MIKKYKNLGYKLFREKFIDNEISKLEHDIFIFYHEYIKKQMNFYKLNYHENIGEIYILFLRALFNYDYKKCNFKTYISKWIRKHALNYDIDFDLFEDNKDYEKNLTNYDSIFNDIQLLSNKLSSEQMFILNNYFGLLDNDQKSLRKIAGMIGCSHVTVHKKLEIILKKIKPDLKNVFLKINQKDFENANQAI
jgi:RNA polymerase sigma factor (sigma-70 family)